MTIKTMYHATDESNVDSIKQEGLQPQRPGGLVFFMDNKEDAREYGTLMPGIENPVVFQADVQEHALRPDSEEPGDYPAYEKTGGIPAHNVEMA